MCEQAHKYHIDDGDATQDAVQDLLPPVEHALGPIKGPRIELEAGRLDLLDRRHHRGERVAGLPVEVGVAGRTVAFDRDRGVVASRSVEDTRYLFGIAEVSPQGVEIGHVVTLDVMPAAVERPGLELLGQAGMVAVRVVELASPAKGWERTPARRW